LAFVASSAHFFLGLILRKDVWQARQHAWAISGVAVTFTLSALLFFYAIQHTTLGLAINLIYLGPVWVTVYEWRREGRHLLRLMTLCLGLLGTYLTTVRMLTIDSPKDRTGIAAALLASLGFAAFTLTQKQAGGRGANSMVIAFWSLVLGSGTAGWTILLAPWTLQVLAFALLIGILNGALYLWILTRGIRACNSATEAGVLQYAEVAFTWMVGAIAYHEEIHWNGIAGAICIFIAGLLTLVVAQKKNRAT
jgi:drug/metabolite transporter (DMT)-like permease